MGIVNTSPDSFSDGGLYSDIDSAVEHCYKISTEGAEIIDIGGESTRPGSEPITEEEEISRVVPVLEKTRNILPDTIISVDTYKAGVAERCIDAGIDIINDISSLQFDGRMGDLLKEHPEIHIIMMHIQGTPKNMQINPRYNDVVTDIIDFFEERIDYCLKKGISKERLIIDPGIGFGKKFEHNIEIIRRLAEFRVLQCPVALGASRKSFINHIYPSEPQDRLAGSLAATSFALQNNVELIRVHDVKENRQFIDTYYAIMNRQSS